MRKKLITTLLVTSIAMIGTNGCSTKAPRIEPGELKVTENTTVKMAKIANIVQLSEKEVSAGKDILGGLTGALIGSAITGGDAELITTIVGSEIGEQVVKDKYGKTIHKLTLSFDDGSVREVYAKGGTYLVGTKVKTTIDKQSDNVTSFIVVK